MTGLFAEAEGTTRRGIGGHHLARSDTDVWLTPPFILEALGPFDLDPCAASSPRPWPTAATMWTREDGSLKRPWFGRVWCNPPYGPPPVIAPWLRRMVEHGSGTALIFARTETALFFEAVWRAADAVMFLEGRLYFHHQDGRCAEGNAGGPSCLVAYGAEDVEVLATSGLAGYLVRLR